jgi:hypothetical protein
MTPQGGIAWGVYLTGADAICTLGTSWTGSAGVNRPGQKRLFDQKSQPYPPHGSFRGGLVTPGSTFELNFTGTYEGAQFALTWQVNIKCLVP